MSNQKWQANVAGVQQSGAVLLLTVVLLLTMVTLVTLYTGKVQIFEHRIVLNTQNHALAHAAASAGLEKAIARVNVNKSWFTPEVEGRLDDDSHYTAVGSTLSLLGNRLLITLAVKGQSADGLAQVHISEQLLVYPLVFNLPVAPLSVSGGFGKVGRFELVFNPDGLGEAEPLSLWSDTWVKMSGTSHLTCSYDAFSKGACSTEAHSDATLKLTDIADDSTSFPTDLLAYIFNIRFDERGYLKEQADEVLSDCDSLNIDSVGMFWVDGDCTINASTQVGTGPRPVVMVILDGSLTFKSDAVFYGLIVSLKSLGSPTALDINMLGTAHIVGALVANYQLGNSAGLTRVVYSDKVLRQLHIQPQLKRVARVPGSWRDF